MNGNEVSARIRIDNLTNANGRVDLYEAKFSLEQITEGNFARSFTPNQSQAFSIITTGTNVSIFVRGQNGGRANLPSGTEIDLNNATFNIVTNNGQSGQSQVIKSVPLKQN